MLGPDRFTFETPNVIDPGDMPPVAPRRESQKSFTPSTHSSSDGEDDDDDYQQARISRARLLRDIDDLELSGDDHRATIRRHSYDENEEEEEDHPHHSLPTAEEARWHATSLLSANKDPERFGRTVRIDAPYRKHLIRRRIIHLAVRYGWIPLLLLVVVCGVILVIVRTRAASSSLSTDSIAQTRKYNYFVDFLSKSGISSVHHLVTEGTPQHQAVLWLSREDTALPTNVPTNLLTDYRFVQRYILAVFYFAMNGTEWKENSNFLSPQHECAWYAPQYYDQFLGHYYAVGVTCDAVEMKVRDLFLPQNRLMGSLPTELVHLMNLKMLALPGNTVFGQVPSAFQALSQLTYLDFKYNQISGNIPDWISNLKHLQVLALSNNLMEGSVPDSLSALTRLHTLALDDNLLTGNLTFAESLTTLEYFYADRNLFAFTMDQTFLSQLSKLDELDLSSNEISATELPLHLLQHPTLDVLDLADNHIQATLPSLLEQPNWELEFLSLRDNRLYGSVPSNMRFLHRLKHLDLQNNGLTGKLPLELKELLSLHYLALGHNNFTRMQDLPPFLDELSHLRELSLPACSLTGTIPGWLAQYLPQLVFLDLSHNQLKRNIPTNLWQMPNLEIVLLHDNMLSGSVSSAEEGTDALQVVTLHRNLGVTGDLTPICENGSILVGYDCDDSIECTCCSVCCQEGEDCYRDELHDALVSNEGLWEFKYEPSPFGMEPDLMDKNDLFSVLHQQESP